MTPEELQLPTGFKYGGPYVPVKTRDYPTTAMIEVMYPDGRPVCRAHFQAYRPLHTIAFPDDALLVRVDASGFDDDDETARQWAVEASEAYGGLPVHFDGWQCKHSYYQGRWVDRETADPVPV